MDNAGKKAPPHKMNMATYTSLVNSFDAGYLKSDNHYDLIFSPDLMGLHFMTLLYTFLSFVFNLSNWYKIFMNNQPKTNKQKKKKIWRLHQNPDHLEGEKPQVDGRPHFA